MFRRITLWEWAALLSLALPVAAVWIWNRSWWTLIVFVLWMLAVIVFMSARHRRKYRERCGRISELSHLSTLRTLSHHRHDWMNELQILYGYLRLNKFDKAVDVVDRIRMRMEQDSRTSQLGIPELAVYLLSFRTVCDTMRLETDIQDGLQLDKLPIDATRLCSKIIGLINVFRFRATLPLHGENVLKLRLSHGDGHLKIVMDYDGELAAADSVIEELIQILDGIGHLDRGIEPAEHSQQARTMVIHFPLPA